MKKARKAIFYPLGGLVALAGIAWLGTKIPPRQFARPDEDAPDLGNMDIPADLPPVVYRHFLTVFGDRFPRIQSAVVWGRAFIKAGLWMPLRFKAYYLPGMGFCREMEITWFGIPVLRGNDSYINGVGKMEIAGKISDGPKIDQGQVLALWAETVALPSAYLATSQVRWQTIDEHTARLTVPYNQGEEHLQVKFHPQSGLMRQMSALRYRDQEIVKTPWRVEYLEWQRTNSILIPRRVSVTWEDQNKAWAYWTLDGAAYNLDISDKIPVN